VSSSIFISECPRSQINVPLFPALLILAVVVQFGSMISCSPVGSTVTAASPWLIVASFVANFWVFYLFLILKEFYCLFQVILGIL